jgi:aminoglycoside 2''-phosphotransferase
MPSAITTSQGLVAGLLHELGLSPRLITPINDGWDSDVFDVDGEWIFRFPRRPEVVASHERECRILSPLAGALPFAIPVPAYVGEFEDRRYMGYARVGGLAYVAGDDASSVGRAIRALHDFPAERAAALLDCDPTIAGWLADYAQLRATTDERVAPLLHADVRAALDAAFDAFFADEWDAVTPVLVHRDLGAEHMLMDRETRALVGMIDFGDAAVGDPTIDFVGLYITGGSAATACAIADYEGPVSEARLRFYMQVGAVHAVLYGQDTGDDDLATDAVASLVARLLGHDLT